jgi:hypothetical protein
LEDLGQGWRTLLRACAKLSIDFEESLSHGHGNFEDQNRFLEPSIMIIIIALLLLLILQLGHAINPYYTKFIIKAFWRNAVRERIWK